MVATWPSRSYVAASPMGADPTLGPSSRDRVVTLSAGDAVRPPCQCHTLKGVPGIAIACPAVHQYHRQPGVGGTVDRVGDVHTVLGAHDSLRARGHAQTLACRPG